MHSHSGYFTMQNFIYIIKKNILNKWLMPNDQLKCFYINSIWLCTRDIYGHGVTRHMCWDVCFISSILLHILLFTQTWKSIFLAVLILTAGTLHMSVFIFLPMLQPSTDQLINQYISSTQQSSSLDGSCAGWESWAFAFTFCWLRLTWMLFVGHDGFKIRTKEKHLSFLSVLLITFCVFTGINMSLSRHLMTWRLICIRILRLLISFACWMKRNKKWFD